MYLLNHISCFHKIYMIRCVNTHIQILKVWLKSVLHLLKCTFFSRGLVLIGTPGILSLFLNAPAFAFFIFFALTAIL